MQIPLPTLTESMALSLLLSFLGLWWHEVHEANRGCCTMELHALSAAEEEVN